MKLRRAGEMIWKHWKPVGFFLTSLLAFALAWWKFPTWQLLIGVIAGGVFLFVLLWKLPEWQVAYSIGLKPENQFDRENEARKTLSQIVAGLLLLVGFYFTWQNLVDNRKATQESEKATQKNLRIASEGQITDRFTKAIAQLGDTKLEVRLGGIYALERIARDSPRDHWPIMEVLTAYARDVKHEPVGKRQAKEQRVAPEPDIQAILTVIGRRTLTYGAGENQHLNLRGINLEGANLRGANLRGADLRRAHLGVADLRGADLEGVNLREASLRGANLDGADLRGANLSAGADLVAALLRGADLRGANLYGADLTLANLTGANLRGVDLSEEVNGLRQEQIESADGDETTKLPEGLQRPKHWVRQTH